MSSMSSIPLVKCKVLYLGSSVPLETSVGLESVQQPIRDRYAPTVDSNGLATVDGIDAHLTIFSSGLLLEYINNPKSTIWFPINALHVCCAVKLVPGSNPPKFVPIENQDNNQSPPLFATITRRVTGKKVLECHTFVCKSVETALALVQSCTYSFKTKQGWLEDNSQPNLDFLKRATSGGNTGMLYGANEDQIRSYQIGSVDSGNQSNGDIVKDYFSNWNNTNGTGRPVLFAPQSSANLQAPDAQHETIVLANMQQNCQQESLCQSKDNSCNHHHHHSRRRCHQKRKKEKPQKIEIKVINNKKPPPQKQEETEFILKKNVTPACPPLACLPPPAMMPNNIGYPTMLPQQNDDELVMYLPDGYDFYDGDQFPYEPDYDQDYDYGTDGYYPDNNYYYEDSYGYDDGMYPDNFYGPQIYSGGPIPGNQLPFVEGAMPQVFGGQMPPQQTMQMQMMQNPY